MVLLSSCDLYTIAPTLSSDCHSDYCKYDPKTNSVRASKPSGPRMRPRPPPQKKTVRRDNRSALQKTKQRFSPGVQPPHPRVQRALSQYQSQRQFMTAETDRYFHALHAPFDERAVGAGIPSIFPLPSHKFTTRTCGTFYAGQAGLACIGLRPFRMFCSDVVYSTVTQTSAAGAVCCTTATSTQTDFSILNSSIVPLYATQTDVVLYGGLNSPYTSANFATDGQRSLRLVGAGIKVRYTGAFMNMQGQLYTWRNPNIAAAVPAAADALSDFIAQGTGGFSPVDENWHGCSYVPLVPDHLDAQADPGNNNYVVLNNPMGFLSNAIMMVGLPAGAPIAFEAVAHYEAYGRALTTTITKSDVQGAAWAVASVPKITSSDIATAFNAALDIYTLLSAGARQMGFMRPRP